MKLIKVAEHTFRALLLTQCSARARTAKNCRFICLMPPLSVLFFRITEQSVLMVLVFYDKCMLENATMQRTPQFEDFSLLSKEPS